MISLGTGTIFIIVHCIAPKALDAKEIIIIIIKNRKIAGYTLHVLFMSLFAVCL